MTSYYAAMPTVAVYVSAADARSLEAEGKKVDEWVRAVVKAGLSKRDEGPAGMTTTQPEEVGRISRDAEGPKAQPLVPRSESPTASASKSGPTPGRCGMSNRHHMNSKQNPCPRCGYPA